MTNIKLQMEGVVVEITKSELTTPELISHAMGVFNELIKTEMTILEWRAEQGMSDDDETPTHPNDPATTNEPGTIEVPDHFRGYV